MLKKLSYYCLLYLRSFFFLLAKIPFVLIIMFIGFYAFYINDQGLDMMASFSFMKIFTHAYISYVVIFLFIWARTIWNVCRVLLGAANLKRLVEGEVDPSTVLPEGQKLNANLVIARIDPNYKRIIEALVKWVPRALALIPYLIFIAAYIKENGDVHLYNMIIVALVGIIHFFVLVYRRPMARKIAMMRKGNKNKPLPKLQKAYSWEEERNLWHAIKKAGVVSNSIVTLAAVIFVFSYAIIAAFSLPTDPSKPGLIILSALSVYTFIGLFINLFINRFRIPVFILLVLFAVFYASTRNENHNVQMLRSAADTKMLSARKIDSAYFSEWIDSKSAKWGYDSTKKNTIFLIAAEGGGIRNCYWTYAVLQKLQNLQPGFYDHTFAVTGASGGSMGLGFYYNYIYHNRDRLNKSDFFIRGDDSVRLDAICSADYLSGVTYGFLYPDLVQRFIPWPIESWDRSKYLSNSFDAGFSAKAGRVSDHLLNHNYQEMWSGTDLYDHPAILFNSTWAEGGTKAIFSPYILSPAYYADALDILTVTKRPVPMKEGMLSSARFPLLTSTGLIYYDSTHDKDNEPKKLGHLFDGGGFENTGIQTAQQTAIMIKNTLAHKKLSGKFKIAIIYIGFGAGSMAPENRILDSVKYHDPIGSEYEFSSIIGGANTIFRWIYAAHGLTIQLDPDMNLLEFGLRSKFDSTKHKLPLGLYLSPTSKDTIRNEIRDIGMQKNLKRSIEVFNRYFNK
ncbi:MAG: hypothetical protein ABI741_08885 [Ferruginibacter sp.]